MASVEDRECEELVVEWIEQVTGESKGMLSVAEWLRSGQVLCGLVNKIKPRLIKVGKMLSPHHKKDNIKKFLKVAARDFGLPQRSLFSPTDLYEEKNMARVVACVLAIAEVAPKVAPNFQGPSLGSLSFSGAARTLLLMVTPGVHEVPVLPPQSFTPYGKNFSSMDAAAWSNIHAMFSKAKPSVPMCGVHEAAVTPPQSFTPYGKNFSSMDAAAWRNIHAMFSKAEPSVPLCGVHEAPVMPPQSFMLYGKNFSSMDGAAWSDIHAMFTKPKPWVLPCGIEELSTHAGSENGGESYVDDETDDDEMDVPIVGKRLLPSMGGFHGAGGLFGGLLRSNPLSKLHQDVLVETPVPAADKSFLPSMGSFHGAGGRYGGVRLVVS